MSNPLLPISTQFELNEYGQPVGLPIPNFRPAQRPKATLIQGQYCILEKLNADKHGEALYRSTQLDPEGKLWTYLPYGPFNSLRDFKVWLEKQSNKPDPHFFCVKNRTNGEPVGFFSLTRIFPEAGNAELAHVYFSPALKRTRIATDAVFQIIKHVFELGNRRCEWKCNSLNNPSCNAALRFGFSFEGVFRSAQVVKGRNRDTAWFSLQKDDWEQIKRCYTMWLDENNFEDNGIQKISLSALTAPLLHWGTDV